MRVSRELSGMRQRELRGWWCDGFIPDVFEIVGQRCRIVGKVWMALGKERQERWDFMLHLGPAGPCEQIDWATMLPAEDWTGWLSLDSETKFMKVNPLVA